MKLKNLPDCRFFTFFSIVGTIFKKCFYFAWKKPDVPSYLMYQLIPHSP